MGFTTSVVVDVVGIDVNVFWTTSVLDPPAERVGTALRAEDTAEDTEDTGVEDASEAEMEDAGLDGAPEEDTACEVAVTVSWERDEKRLELSRESEDAMLELSRERDEKMLERWLASEEERTDFWLARDDDTDEEIDEGGGGSDRLGRELRPRKRCRMQA